MFKMSVNVQLKYITSIDIILIRYSHDRYIVYQHGLLHEIRPVIHFQSILALH